MTHQHPDDISVNFIVSTDRSGSTLLALMLNMHPNAISVSEETFTYSLFLKYKNVTIWNSQTIQQFIHDFYLFSDGILEPQFGSRKDLEVILEDNKNNLSIEKAIKLTHLCFFPNKDKSHVTTIVDKHLIFHSVLEEVAAFYPNAKFILLCRDPRDNALTKCRRAQRENRRVRPYSYYALAWTYVYSTLLHKKNKIGAQRFLDIKYENLVSEPEITLQKISNFLNIPYSDIMLQYDVQLKKELQSREGNLSDTFKKEIDLSHKGLTEKVNTNKVGFWKENLKPEEADLIWSVASKPAQALGYEKEGCNEKSVKNFNYIISYIWFYFNYVFVSGVYFKLPVFVRTIIKQLKYGRKLKVTE